MTNSDAFIVIIAVLLFFMAMIIATLPLFEKTISNSVLIKAPLIMTIPDNELTKFQKTDVVRNIAELPFMTLTESKLANHWYHPELDNLFVLTPDGFVMKRGNKKELAEMNMLR